MQIPPYRPTFQAWGNYREQLTGLVQEPVKYTIFGKWISAISNKFAALFGA
jgi:hypothetical protein